MHSGAEQVPQIWVLWVIAERGLHGQAWRREADTGSWSSEQLREGDCSWPSSVPYLSLLFYFFFFFFANSDSGAQEQIQCDLRGLAGSWTLPSACEKTSSLPSLFVLFHFTLVVLFSVINLAWSLFSQVYTAALSEFSCNTWDVSLASSLCSICVLGSGVLEHEISYCFLCRQYAMISLYSESTYWLSVMFTCRTNLC